MPPKRKHDDESDDEAYVDASDSRGQSRPAYSQARKAVAARQKLRRTASGNLEYKSAVTPNTWNKLDSKGRETFPKQAHKGGSITQQPALDHVVQYAALNEHYHASVEAERDKAAKALKRTDSFDLHRTFQGAVADDTNLRLVSHAEHVAAGGSKRTGGFTSKEKRDARALFDKHVPATQGTKSQLTAFNHLRPKSSVPLPQGTPALPSSSRTLRPRKKVKPN